jgi:hypothetical protein
MRVFRSIGMIVLSAFALINVTSSIAGDAGTPTQILINNVHVWDGISDGDTKKISILVVIKDGKIFKNTL